MSRKIFHRIDMTLQSLKIYGYIGSKTKKLLNTKKISSAIYLLCILALQIRPSILFDLFPILLGAPRPLPKSRSCPNNSLNHHRVPCHLPCGFGLFL